MKEAEILHLISVAYEQKKMFESILFESNNQEQLTNLMKKLSQFLYCEKHRFESDACLTCQKLEQGKILDLHFLGNGFAGIKKEELKLVLDDLMQSAKVFNQPKILIIANAENLKVDAANSLLKFLEEPVPNTFLFLLTTNKNLVLPTIKSRTKVFSLDVEKAVVEDNFLLTVLAGNKPETILLLNHKLKKMNQEELIVLVDKTLPFFLENNDLQFYQLGLELINDLKFDPNTALAIDRFLIGISGVNSWKF